MTHIHALFVPLIFEQGISAGDGSDMNQVSVARDGKGRLVLRGTSIAGVLRHACDREWKVQDPSAVERWFGAASDTGETESRDSRVSIDTAVLNSGQSDVVNSSHHLRNRHTGVVTKYGLFSIESCPPGTTTTVAIWIRADNSQDDEVRELIDFLAQQFGRGLIFGGRSARGIGRSSLVNAISHSCYDLARIDDVTAYLSESRSWRVSQDIPGFGTKLKPRATHDAHALSVTLKLRIPTGQDMLVAQPDQWRPQRVKNADGEEYWKLPGSTIRGAFKDWMTRLAALDGFPVQDSHESFTELDSVAAIASHPRQHQITSDRCPINDLFGTVEKPSRIHFADAYAPIDQSGNEQHRMHVMIDRISGGAAEGLLFANDVLTLDDDGQSPEFELRIEIKAIKECEWPWLAKSIVSLNHGVIRVGSGKSSGRLTCDSISGLGSYHGEVTDFVNKYMANVGLAEGSAAMSVSEGDEAKRRASKPDGGSKPAENRHANQGVDPKFLGLPFTNPYTFKPFKKEAPVRTLPTYRTADEQQGEPNLQRFTGFVDLNITTRRPLLTSESSRDRHDTQKHQTLKGLCIGDDVVVPKTGIRGSLRSLMSLLTGGSLVHMNANTYLCQGRDLTLFVPGFDQKMEQAKKSNPDSHCAHGVLARVVRAGTVFQEGTVELGDTTLVSCQSIIEKLQGAGLRPKEFRRLRKPIFVAIDEQNQAISVSQKNDAKHPWQVKVSGTPIGGDYDPRTKRGKRNQFKREGAFRPNSRDDSQATITLPPELWEQFNERYANADKQSLKAGDLVWLETTATDGNITEPSQVLSIQWARWCRKGVRLKSLLNEYHQHAIPDSMRTDQQVDEVTALFGQIPAGGNDDAIAFSGRIQPENLVFVDAKRNLTQVTLAPMGRPHPGCIGFYRQGSNPDTISKQDPLAGQKVYRVATEDESPWRWQAQPVFHQGKPKHEKDSQNKTVDLLPEGTAGNLRISFRSLSRRELALLLAVCGLPWRLGGGKPLGLGLCSVRVDRLCDELGQPLDVDGWEWTTGRSGEQELTGWQAEVADLEDDIAWWRASQRGVKKMRYPRAAEKNYRGANAGGHIWFMRHCTPRKLGKQGIEAKRVGRALRQEMQDRGADFDGPSAYVSGQPLPDFDPDDPLADLLYGYDGFAERGDTLDSLELYRWQEHAQDSAPRGRNTNPNAKHRRHNKQNRKR